MKDGYLKKLINMVLYIVMWVGAVIGIVVILALMGIVNGHFARFFH